MGTPISARKALEDVVLRGDYPEASTLHALGLDIKLLEQRHNEIKSLLHQLDGFTKIEENKHFVQYYLDWGSIVADSPYIGERVIRLIRSYWDQNIPLFVREYAPLEIFITRNGDWIVWDGTSRATNETGPQKRLTRHTSVRSMLKRVVELHDPQDCMGPDDYPALRLHLSLVRLLDTSIVTKTQRLNPQVSMRDRFLASDRQNLLVT